MEQAFPMGIFRKEKEYLQRYSFFYNLTIARPTFLILTFSENLVPVPFYI